MNRKIRRAARSGNSSKLEYYEQHHWAREMDAILWRSRDY